MEKFIHLKEVYFNIALLLMKQKLQLGDVLVSYRNSYDYITVNYFNFYHRVDDYRIFNENVLVNK